MKTPELSLRQRKILHLLQNRTGYVQSKELAQELHVSDRTVRSDIGYINHVLRPFGAGIVATPGQGVLFRAEDGRKIQEFCRIDSALLTRSDRVRALAFRLCLSDGPLNLYDLEEELFVSRSALLADLRELRKRYTFSLPNIQMYLRQNEVFYERDELKIRSVLLALLHQDWDYGARANAYYGQHFLDGGLMEHLVRTVPCILYRNRLMMDDPSLVALELSLGIMHCRNALGHAYPDVLPPPDTGTPAGNAAEELVRLAEDYSGRSFPQTERARIYQFISSACRTSSPWREDAGEAERLGPAVKTLVERYLSGIREQFGLDFGEDAEFRRTLLQFFAEIAAGSSALSQHQSLGAIRGRLSMEYEIAFLLQRYAPESIGRYLAQIELANLALCVSGALGEYFQLHPRQKLKAVLFCHRNMAAAWELKRRVLETAGHYLDIVEILPEHYRESYDGSGTDLFLTTVKDGGGAVRTGPETVYIDDMPGAMPWGHAERMRRLALEKLWPVSADSIRVLFDRVYLHESAELGDSLRIIEYMTDDLIRAGVAGREHQTDITDRELITSFAVRPELVFLHSLLPAKETRLSVLFLRRRVEWNEFRVRIVVLLLQREEDRNLLFRLNMLLGSDFCGSEALQRCRTAEQLLSLLQGGSGEP